MKKGHVVSLYEEIKYTHSLTGGHLTYDEKCNELIKNTFKHLLPDKYDELTYTICVDNTGNDYVSYYAFIYRYETISGEERMYVNINVYEDTNEMHFDYKRPDGTCSKQLKYATWDETMRRFEFSDQEN